MSRAQSLWSSFCSFSASTRVSGATPPSQAWHFRSARSVMSFFSGGRRALTSEAAGDVLLDELLELFRDVVALQRDGLLSVLVYRRDRTLAGAWEADTDVGVFAFARAVDYAA